MKRMTHALSAMGAALAFGCGAPSSDVAIPDARDVVYSDEMRAEWSAYSRELIAQIEAEGELEVGRLGRCVEPPGLDDDPRVPGGDGGDVEKAVTVALQGWRVKSTLSNLGNDSSGHALGTHYRPTVTTMSTLAQSINAISGRCGEQPANVIPDACILPATSAPIHSTGKTYKWYLDKSSCTSVASAQQWIHDGTVAAMADLSFNTSWSFVETSTFTGADLHIDCAGAGSAELTQLRNINGIAGASMTGPLTLITSASPDTNTVNPQVVNVKCEADPALTYHPDSFYAYAQGGVDVDWNSFNAQYAVGGGGTGCTAGTDPTFLKNAWEIMIQHEVLHWLGFVHEVDTANPDIAMLNVMYPKSGCADGLFHPISELSTTRPAIVETMNNMDTSATSAFAGPLDYHVNQLGCYKPRSGAPALGELPGGLGADVGWQASFTSDHTYGVQTGSTHMQCDWTSSGQICAVPPSTTINWCWLSEVTTTQRNTIDQYAQILDNHTLIGTPGVRYAFPEAYDGHSGNGDPTGFTFVRHSSCSDAVVQLVVDMKPCPGGSGARISDYVCLDIPDPTGRIVEAWDFSPWGVPPGTYMNWGAKDGFMRMHIDTAKINAKTAGIPGAGVRLTDHAIMAGLGWVIGIGTRKNQDQAWNHEQILPYEKILFHTQDGCKARSYMPMTNGVSNAFGVSGTYCGDDPHG